MPEESHGGAFHALVGAVCGSLIAFAGTCYGARSGERIARQSATTDRVRMAAQLLTDPNAEQRARGLALLSALDTEAAKNAAKAILCVMFPVHLTAVDQRDLQVALEVVGLNKVGTDARGYTNDDEKMRNVIYGATAELCKGFPKE